MIRTQLEMSAHYRLEGWYSSRFVGHVDQIRVVSIAAVAMLDTERDGYEPVGSHEKVYFGMSPTWWKRLMSARFLR